MGVGILPLAAIHMINTMNKDEYIKKVKDFRVDLDAFLKRSDELFTGIPEDILKEFNDVNEVMANSRIAFRHIEDAKMRLGQVLHHMAAPNPYPQGNDPTTAAVDPQADTAGADPKKGEQ